MILTSNTRNEIIEFFREYVYKINQRRFIEEPFDEDKELINSPFNFRIVPVEIWKSSKYERSFVTSTGNHYEKMSKSIGNEKWGFSERHYHKTYRIFESQFNHITTILNELDHRDKTNPRVPNWENEKSELDELCSGNTLEVEVISDVYLYDEENNKQCFIEIKSPKPNKDQSKVSKEKMLKIYCGTNNSEIETDILFCLPFNPYGRRENYNWSFPESYFNMRLSSCVKIGDEYWNYLGKDNGFYDELLQLTDEIGIETKKKISQYIKYGFEFDEVYEKVIFRIENELELNTDIIKEIIRETHNGREDYQELFNLINENNMSLENIMGLINPNTEDSDETLTIPNLLPNQN